MKITHHITDDLLYLYAAGDLKFGWSLAIATHLSLCPSCRATLKTYEQVLAENLAQEHVSEMSVNADDVLAIAGSQMEPCEIAPPVQAEKNFVFPKPLRDLCGDLGDIKWSTMGGGIKQKILHEEDGIVARLLYISPGASASAHGHNGIELTQVVSGGFFDGDQAFERGDIQIVAHDSPHQPIAMNGEACVCLAVTDAPLKFRNFLPRLFQRAFRI
ncbi:ChrR family anti-sigma-E factor [Hirschia litorea]|uniref:ChrR family anti-sigma-E factor n=1 Tax=Hirschia litorea TaxID=1199156 RepID=A0ABW2INM2_9PROT